MSNYAEALNTFSDAFEPDMNNLIDSTVMSFLFPDKYFGDLIEPVYSYEVIEEDFTVYIFQDFLITYMAVFSNSESQLIDFTDVMEDGIRNLDVEAFHGIGITRVRQRFVGEDESNVVMIVAPDGKIHRIKGLSMYEIPYWEEEFGYIGNNMLDDRYCAIEEATDIVGNLLIYDLQEDVCVGNFGVETGSIRYENDTIKFNVTGENLGDSLGLSKLSLMEYHVYDGKLTDSIPAGIMLMH